MQYVLKLMWTDPTLTDTYKQMRKNNKDIFILQTKFSAREKKIKKTKKLDTFSFYSKMKKWRRGKRHVDKVATNIAIFPSTKKS